MKKLLFVAVMGLAAACGDDDGTVVDAPAIDAPSIDGITADAAIDAVAIDGAPSTVQVVACPASAGEIASEVSAPGFAFTVTEPLITTGDIVRFTMPGSHSVISGPPGTPDGKFTVGFNAVVCLRFTTPGDYPFYCNPHQFTASLGVRDPV